jgi:hypothetical protein
MKCLGLILLFLLIEITSSAGTAGSFRGVIVRPPDGEKNQGWIYVQGRNGNLRRAEVSHAQIVYGSGVPVRLRDKDPVQSLIEGTEVRVTAEQDGDGEWRATYIQILKVRSRPKSQPAYRKPNPSLMPA